MARKTSSRSPQSHRTYDGSLNWSPDHHQHQPLRVLRSRCGRQATASKQAPNGACGNEHLKKSRQPLRCHDRRFLQQNRHIAATTVCDGISGVGESGHPISKAPAGRPPRPEMSSVRGLSAVDRGPPAEWDRPGLRVFSAGDCGVASCRARATLRNTDAEHRLRQCRPRSVTGVSRRLSTWLNSLISQYDAAMRAGGG